MPITHGGIVLPVDASPPGKTSDLAQVPSGRWREVDCLGSPTIDDAIIEPLTVDYVPGSSYALPVREASGSVVHALLTVLGTNPTVVKNAPGRLKRVSVFNLTTAILFVKFHNQATTPSAGVSVFFPVPCQAGTWTHLGTGAGMDFSVGIAYTTTLNVTATDTSNVPANSAVIICERV